MSHKHLTFSPDDLQANQEGRFSTDQAADLRSEAQTVLMVGAIFGIGGFVIIGYALTQGSFLSGLLAGLVSLIIGCLAIFISLYNLQVVDENKIAVISGVATIKKIGQGTHLLISNAKFRLKGREEEWFSNGQNYTIYYLHRSKRILSFSDDNQK